MKENAHPPYQEVLFVDSSTGFKFVCGSALQTNEREVFNGKELPVIRVAISSSSHPYFVGGQKYVDTEGRVDKFNKRYQAQAQKAQAVKAEQETEAANEEKPEKKPSAKKKKK